MYTLCGKMNYGGEWEFECHTEEGLYTGNGLLSSDDETIWIASKDYYLYFHSGCLQFKLNNSHHCKFKHKYCKNVLLHKILKPITINKHVPRTIESIKKSRLVSLNEPFIKLEEFYMHEYLFSNKVTTKNIRMHLWGDLPLNLDYFITCNECGKNMILELAFDSAE